MINIPLITNEGKLLNQLNNSIVWYKNNKVSEMNAEFDIDSMNTLYSGLYSLLETLRVKASNYGIRLSGTISGNVISGHSTKVSTPLPRNITLKSVNSSFVQIDKSLSLFNADLLMEIKGSAEKLTSIGNASFGDSDGGDSISNLISSLRSDANALLAALDADLAQEVVAEAQEDAGSQTEEEVTEAKEEAVTVTDEEAQAHMDDINAAWDAAEKAAEDAMNEAQQAARDAAADAKAALEAWEAAGDAFETAYSGYQNVEEEARIASEKEDALADLDGYTSANGWDSISNDPYNPTVIEETSTGRTEAYVDEDGVVHVAVINDEAGTKTETTTTKDNLNDDLISAAAEKMSTEAERESEEQRLRDAEAELERTGEEMGAAAEEAAAAKDAAAASGNDGTTTIEVGDGNGGTVTVTFTEDTGDDEE